MDFKVYLKFILFMEIDLKSYHVRPFSSNIIRPIALKMMECTIHKIFFKFNLTEPLCTGCPTNLIISDIQSSTYFNMYDS